MNLENFIEETKTVLMKIKIKSTMYCDEYVVDTSNLNANLETSNEKTRNVSSLVELVVFVKNRFYSRNEECFAADNTTRYIEDKTRRVTQKKTIIGENL